MHERARMRHQVFSRLLRVVLLVSVLFLAGVAAIYLFKRDAAFAVNSQERSVVAQPSERPTPDLMKASYAEIGKPAIDFALSDLDGNTIWLSDYLGKVVIISFWATWCPPCQAEIPELVTMYPELLDKDVVILAVNFRESDDTVYAFTQEMQMNFPVLLDPMGYLAYAYGVRGLPTSLFIDRQGVLRYRYLGGLDQATIEDILAKVNES